MRPKPSVVVCLFDQKSDALNLSTDAKSAQMKAVPYTASDIICYCTRLDILPGRYTPPLNLPFYITRGGAVGAVAFCNFRTRDLAGMSRELERDALMASKSLSRPWIHGCISIDVGPAEFDGEPDDLLGMGHALMKMFGVDENRYMLAVHLDSGKIHVHFLYARVDAEGRLRERNRKLPKFMAEEATALLAHQFGFSLEPRHLSRVTPDGILDLASDRIVRDLEFVELIDGMKSRNTARKKTKRNELLTLALVARHEARNILEFRTLLAPHGITYEKKGSGAELVDIKGRKFNASDVDEKRRFTPTNMFNGALLIDFPETPEALRHQAERVRADAKLAQDIRQHANLADGKQADANLAAGTHADANLASATPTSNAVKSLNKAPLGQNEKSNLDRFFADRSPDHENATDVEKRWDAAAAATMKSRPGRPPKDPIMPGWPAPTRFHGCLGSREGRQARVQFSDAYTMIETASQTEVWRKGELVASIRYSRMAIISNKEEDLREALLAAHRAWGTVEIFGKPEFKRQMAKLAAEMNIPLSNPELQDGIARMTEAMRQSASMPSTHKTVEGRKPTLENVGEPSSAITVAASDSDANDKALPCAPVAPARPRTRGDLMSPAQVTTPPTGAAPRMTNPAKLGSEHRQTLTYLSRSIELNDWSVRQDPSDPTRLTLFDNEIRAFRIDRIDLLQPEIQARLTANHQRQQADLASLSAAVRNGTAHVLVRKDMRDRESVRLELTSASPLEQVYLRCASHPDFGALMKLAHREVTDARRDAARLKVELAEQRNCSTGAASSIQATTTPSNANAVSIPAPAIDVGQGKTIEAGDASASVPSATGEDGERSWSGPKELEAAIAPTSPPGVTSTTPWDFTTAFTAEERKEILRPRSFSDRVSESDVPRDPASIDQAAAALSAEPGPAAVPTNETKGTPPMDKATGVLSAEPEPAAEPTDATKGTPPCVDATDTATTRRIDPVEEAAKAAAALSRLR